MDKLKEKYDREVKYANEAELKAAKKMWERKSAVLLLIGASHERYDDTKNHFQQNITLDVNNYLRPNDEAMNMFHTFSIVKWYATTVMKKAAKTCPKKTKRGLVHTKIPMKEKKSLMEMRWDMSTTRT